MRTKIHSSILYAFLMIAVFVSGIYCKDLYSDPSFSHASDTMGTALLRSVDPDLTTDIYLEKDPLGPTEHLTVIRQSLRDPSGFRTVHLLIAILLSTISCPLLSLCSPFSHTVTLNDHYHQRTLAYIHDNDGKKSQPSTI